jgi:heat-inducible transcriptional repressor
MARRVKPPVGSGELDPRQATILAAVVAEHVDTAQPVGSSSVAAATDLDVSPATVRSEMVSLEREGYLTQPHTSAGRVPTDKGYRYFVDHLERGGLGAAQQTQIREFFAHVRGEMEDVLEQTSKLLSQLTSHTSVVVGSNHAHATILSAQLVNLDAHHHLLVTVFSDGTVAKHSVIATFEASATDVVEASRQLNALLIGTTLGSRVQVPSRTDAVASRTRRATAALHEASPTIEGEQVYIGGSSKVAESFDGVETVRAVLSILEQELVVVSLIEDVLDREVAVAIGSEHGYVPLSACAVIVAPVTLEGETVGALGLLGPTRMRYREVMAAAQAVSSELTRHFGGDGDG